MACRDFPGTLWHNGGEGMYFKFFFVQVVDGRSLATCFRELDSKYNMLSQTFGCQLDSGEGSDSADPTFDTFSQKFCSHFLLQHMAIFPPMTGACDATDQCTQPATQAQQQALQWGPLRVTALPIYPSGV